MILIDNFCECYHCAAAHRDFVDLVDMKSYRTRARGIYRRGRFVVDSGRTEISEHAVHDFQVKILHALSAAV
jgi:hypothetical protein